MALDIIRRFLGILKPGGLQGSAPSRAETLYYDVLAASRAPTLYADYGVEDNIDGRFDALCLMQSLMMRRLSGRDGEIKVLAQGLFDAMFQDMDLTLREMGVGDMGVGKRVKLMSEAYMGRLKSYDDAISAKSIDALAEALRRNLFRAESEHAQEKELAGKVMMLAQALDEIEDEAFLQGNWPQPLLDIAA